MELYRNTLLHIVREESEIPWVKIFTNEPVKELTDCTPEVQTALWQTTLTIERLLRDYYQPDKVNIASFGNMLPRVHIHVMARFEGDSWFPEPTWGRRQREGRLALPEFEGFRILLCETLTRQVQ